MELHAVKISYPWSPATAYYETRRFFELTSHYVSSAVEDREERHEMKDSLYTYVKNDQAPTFTVDEFAERHLPPEKRDQYRMYMRGKQFPERAVKRDIGDLRGRLKRRRFKYGTDIEFSASPEAIAEERVTFQVVEVDAPGGHGGQTMATIITIKEPFTGEK